MSHAELLNPASAPASARDDAEVIVVGAGLAGLNTALHLTDQGVDVLVLEAAARPGGRIRTWRTGDKAIELGGTGLGPSHLRAKALVERFELDTRPLTRRGKFAYSINGTLMAAEDWEHSPANRTVGEEREILPSRMDSYYMQTLLPFFGQEDWLDPAHAGYDIPFGDYLRSRGLSAETIRLVNMCINTNDVEKASALTLFRDAIKWRSVGYTDPKNFDQYGDKQYQPVRVAGGMDQITSRMAAALCRPVQYGRYVHTVEQTRGGVEIACTDGSTYSARRVVVAVPAVTLRRIAFRPGLPAPLAGAIAEAQSSANTQFYLSTDRRFWEDDGFEPSIWSDTLFERLFVEFEADDSVDHLRIWINGDNAARVDALGEAEAGEALLGALAEIRPSTEGHLTVENRVSWGADPLIGGEKYVMGAGQVTRYGAALSQPVGALHWAGEHHKNKEVGIEAALQAGERAAAEVLEAVR